jgi:hypothetical protein
MAFHEVAIYWYFLIKTLDKGDGTLDWKWAENVVDGEIKTRELRADARAEAMLEFQAAQAANAAPGADMDI